MAKFWLAELEKYNEEPFQRKPDETGRSMGQLYAHLIGQAQNFHLINAQKCVESTDGALRGKKTFKGFLTFSRGLLKQSSKRTKAFEKEAPRPYENLMATRDKLIRLIKDMADMDERLEKSGSAYKVKHEELGFLDGREWYQLVELNFRFHIKFKEQVDQYLMK